MIAVWVAVMVVGLIAMIVCSKKQKTNPAMQPVALGVFLVVIVAAVMLMIETNTTAAELAAKYNIPAEVISQKNSGKTEFPKGDVIFIPKK